MRVLYFSAITLMHMVHALPRADLAARQGVNDLDRDAKVHGENVEGSGLYFDNGMASRGEKAERWVMTEEDRVLERRFMRSPDYSEDGSGVGSSDSIGSPPSNSTRTQEAASSETPATTATGDRGAAVPDTQV